MSAIFRTAAIALITLALGPAAFSARGSDGRHAATEVDRVDAIEINYVYDESGRLLLPQVIFWRWGDGELLPIAWRSLRTFPACAPRWNHERRCYESLWNDAGLVRRVYADSAWVTHTQHDRELDARRAGMAAGLVRRPIR